MLLIKIGGSKELNWDYIAEDLKNLDQDYIIIHGANEYLAEINDSMGRIDEEIISPSGYGSRYTTEESIDTFLQAYCGLANKKLVAKLQGHGINAVGLSGVDGKLWEGTRKEKVIGYLRSDSNKKVKVIRDSMVGNVKDINTKLINVLLENSFIPVITAPAISDDNQIINVDNDRAAAVMVEKLNISEMIMLFGAPGLLKDHKDQSSLISNVDAKEIDSILEYADGRMKKKVLGAKEAFAAGLEKMYWGDGRVENPITSLFNGSGTIIE